MPCVDLGSMFCLDIISAVQPPPYVDQELVAYDISLVGLHKTSIVAFHLCCMLRVGVLNLKVKATYFSPLRARPHFRHLLGCQTDASDPQ